MWHQHGDLTACLMCYRYSLFVESSSGQPPCPDRFCPENLQVCPQPARTMAAKTYGCHEELFQSPHNPAEVSTLLKELTKTQAPRTRHNPFREEWEDLYWDFLLSWANFTYAFWPDFFCDRWERIYSPALQGLKTLQHPKTFCKRAFLHDNCSYNESAEVAKLCNAVSPIWPALVILMLVMVQRSLTFCWKQPTTQLARGFTFYF